MKTDGLNVKVFIRPGISVKLQDTDACFNHKVHKGGTRSTRLCAAISLAT